MRAALLLTLLLPVTVVAEELPDTAPAQERDPRDMEARFSAGAHLDATEMEDLFLESPSLLADPESRHGQDARTREERQRDVDLVLSRQISARQYLQGVEALTGQEPQQEPLLEMPLPLLLDDLFDNELLQEEQRRMFERQAPEQF